WSHVKYAPARRCGCWTERGVTVRGAWARWREPTATPTIWRWKCASRTGVPSFAGTTSWRRSRVTPLEAPPMAVA
ncbi:MAG: hypothetical protein AVDCRST_MAG22-911, partial [uncultured Rubrobacteraceae bacterium]